MGFTTTDIIKIILSIIFPPLGVLSEKGCDKDLCINIFLTMLGYIPGNLFFYNYFFNIFF